MSKRWEPYNPQWLVELTQQQMPEEKEVIDSLGRCTSCLKSSRAYIYFVDGSNPNQKGSAWQFQRNIRLEDKKFGTIILDILKGNEVGGIEFLKYLK